MKRVFFHIAFCMLVAFSHLSAMEITSLADTKISTIDRVFMGGICTVSGFCLGNQLYQLLMTDQCTLSSCGAMLAFSISGFTIAGLMYKAGIPEPGVSRAHEKILNLEERKKTLISGQ
jgi:hypothetical protein